MAKIVDRLRDALGRTHPKTAVPTSSPQVPIGSLKERLDARFEEMMQEVDELSHSTSTLEEHAEYGWIVGIRLLLPIVFFIGFGYEDGLFMTGFRYLSLEPFVLLMYTIGYGLEGLRVAMVYSMNFSKSEGRQKAYSQQFTFWVVMSLGTGIAQLASALVIQALGSDQAIVGNNAVAQGASIIMAHIPFLVYVAIAIRVALCAIADWACSGYLHKKKQTVEQKVAVITTKATNLQTVIQAHINAQTMTDNAQRFQDIIADERAELKQLRGSQKTLFDMVFQAGMSKFRTQIEEVEASQPPLLNEGRNQEEE